MNKYEITFITKEDAKEKAVKAEIDSLGGKILAVSSLGQKQFVYRIQKETAGYYTSVSFEIEPQKVIELNAKLNLKPEILRHLIITARAAKIAAPKEKPMVAKKEEKKLPEPPEIEKLPQAEKEAVIPKAVKKPAKKVEPVPEKPKPTRAAKEIEEEEISTDERLKALDKKLDELLKE